MLLKSTVSMLWAKLQSVVVDSYQWQLEGDCKERPAIRYQSMVLEEVTVDGVQTSHFFKLVYENN